MKGLKTICNIYKLRIVVNNISLILTFVFEIEKETGESPESAFASLNVLNLGDFISLAILIIVIASGLFGCYRWFNLRKKPSVDVYLIKNPLNEGETAVQEMRVPANRDVILYWGIGALDNRVYLRPNFWIYFPREFKINYLAPYERIYFGKIVRPHKSHEARFVSDTPLIKGQTGHLAFPVVVKTPSEIGKYEVGVEFSSESIKSSSIKRLLYIEVSKDDYSQNEKFFECKTFIPQTENSNRDITQT